MLVWSKAHSVRTNSEYSFAQSRAWAYDSAAAENPASVSRHPVFYPVDGGFLALLVNIIAISFLGYRIYKEMQDFLHCRRCVVSILVSRTAVFGFSREDATALQVLARQISEHAYPSPGTKSPWYLSISWCSPNIASNMASASSVHSARSSHWFGGACY